MGQFKFQGTGVAMVTPFRKDGSINFNSIGKLVEHLVGNNINFLVILGTTAEVATLTVDEKEAVINYIVDVVNKRLPIILGLGGNNTQELINQINSIDFEGIDAIMSVVPYYNKPNQKGIFQHFKSIGNSTPLPVIVYNVPSRTGVNMTADTCLKLAREIHNIIAVKEASGNIEQIMKIIKDKPDDFHVLSGDDFLALPIISLGGCGVISVVANAFPKQVSDMVSNSLKGYFKTARTQHYNLLEIFNLIFAEGNPAGVKAALDYMDIVPNFLRLPLTPVSSTLYKSISQFIKQADLSSSK